MIFMQRVLIYCFLMFFSKTAYFAELHPAFFILPGLDVSPLAVQLEEDWAYWAEVDENDKVSRIISFNDFNFLYESVNNEKKARLLAHLGSMFTKRAFDTEGFLKDLDNFGRPKYLSALYETIRTHLSSFLEDKERGLASDEGWKKHYYTVKVLMVAYNDIIWDATKMATKKANRNVGYVRTRHESYSSQISRDRSLAHLFYRNHGYKDAKHFATRIGAAFLKRNFDHPQRLAWLWDLSEIIIRIKFLQDFDILFPLAYKAVMDGIENNETMDWPYIDQIILKGFSAHRPWIDELNRIKKQKCKQAYILEAYPS